MQENERRQALAEFLRSRRERLTPAEVGLPTGFRRRTPGLRREEVAQLANIGTSWYIWLEQGRDVNPSPLVLESVSQALQLTLNERRHLFMLAGQALPPHFSPGEEKVSPTLQRVLQELNPTPAYIMGRRWDLLAWNQAANYVFGISEGIEAYGYNILWRFFASPIVRKRYPNWAEVGRSLLGEFSTASARYPNDAWFEELIEDLKQLSPEFRQWWPHPEASRSMDGHKTMEHATLGHLDFEHTTLQVPNDPDVRVMIYTPLPETANKVQQALGEVTANSEQVVAAV